MRITRRGLKYTKRVVIKMKYSTYQKIDKIMPWLLGFGWAVVIIVGIALSLASAADLIDIITIKDEE